MKIARTRSGIALSLGLGATVVLGAASAFAADAVETPKDLIAIQIRDQGYKCDQATGAERDTAASKPNEAVWILTCEDARYRVRLVPDVAAQVERLSTGSEKGTDK